MLKSDKMYDLLSTFPAYALGKSNQQILEIMTTNQKKGFRFECFAGYTISHVQWIKVKMIHWSSL